MDKIVTSFNTSDTEDPDRSGKWVSADTDMQGIVHWWLRGQDKDFFLIDVQVLVHRWCKYVVKQEDRFDK